MEFDYIKQGDCLELMKEIPDNSIDLILTDPPYEFKKGGFGGGVGEFAKRNLKADVNNEKLHQSFDEITLMFEFERVLKKMNCVIFGTEQMMNKLMNYCEQKNYTYTLTIWHKTNPTPLCNNRYLNSIEFAIHIRESGVKIHGDYHSKSKVYTSSVNKQDKNKYGHPTIKPIELIEKYIKNHSVEDDIILDPFLGSGTTAAACVNMNRHYIGFELDEEYFDIACQRLDEVECVVV